MADRIFTDGQLTQIANSIKEQVDAGDIEGAREIYSRNIDLYKSMNLDNDINRLRELTGQNEATHVGGRRRRRRTRRRNRSRNYKR